MDLQKHEKSINSMRACFHGTCNKVMASCFPIVYASYTISHFISLYLSQIGLDERFFVCVCVPILCFHCYSPNEATMRVLSMSCMLCLLPCGYCHYFSIQRRYVFLSSIQLFVFGSRYMWEEMNISNICSSHFSTAQCEKKHEINSFV